MFNRALSKLAVERGSYAAVDVPSKHTNAIEATRKLISALAISIIFCVCHMPQKRCYVRVLLSYAR